MGRTITIPLDIGDWDMNTNMAKNVTLPGALASKIQSIGGYVRPDAGSPLGDVKYPMGLARGVGAALTIDAWSQDGADVTISLSRADLGLFDSANFDSIGYNRGELLIEYEI